MGNTNITTLTPLAPAAAGASSALAARAGEAPVRGSGSSFSRPAALIGVATALIALTALATSLVMRPAAPVAESAGGTTAGLTASAAAGALATQAMTHAKPAERSVAVDDGVDAPAGATPSKVATPTPAAKPAPKPAPRAVTQPTASAKAPSGAAAAQTTGAPAEQRVAAVAPCTNCGVVESVTSFQKKGEGSGVGAVAGGVIGGVIGNQMGGGKGKKAMTVLGAVGGGMAGHEIEKRQRATTMYSVKVRMEDGTLRTMTQTSAPVVGQKVTVDGSEIRSRG
jgi:outer membrane lipoprotein SlyB